MHVPVTCGSAANLSTAFAASLASANVTPPADNWSTMAWLRILVLTNLKLGSEFRQFSQQLQEFRDYYQGGVVTYHGAM